MKRDKISAAIADLLTAIANLMVPVCKLGAVFERLQALLNDPSKPVETPFEANLRPFECPFERSPIPAPASPRRPFKIDDDPELRAFIVARIKTATLTALEREVAKAFPPDRRIGKSAIHHR